MSITAAGYRRTALDHFEPQDDSDPQAQRRLRGQLEQIDYTAFAANRSVLGQALGRVGGDTFKRLATAAAHARARWIAESIATAGRTLDVGPAEIERLATLRRAYEELSEAYEAMRRVVERGYCASDAAVGAAVKRPDAA